MPLLHAEEAASEKSYISFFITFLTSCLFFVKLFFFFFLFLLANDLPTGRATCCFGWPTCSLFVISSPRPSFILFYFIFLELCLACYFSFPFLFSLLLFLTWYRFPENRSPAYQFAPLVKLHLLFIFMYIVTILYKNKIKKKTSTHPRTLLARLKRTGPRVAPYGASGLRPTPVRPPLISLFVIVTPIHAPFCVDSSIHDLPRARGRFMLSSPLLSIFLPNTADPVPPGQPHSYDKQTGEARPLFLGRASVLDYYAATGICRMG